MTSSPIPAARGQYLLDLLAQVPDPRKRRGRRHPLAGLLATAIRAVTAGSRSFAAIGQWAADAGPDVLAGLGAARGPAEESTFRRAFALVSPDVLDRLLGTWLHTRAGAILWHRKDKASANRWLARVQGRVTECCAVQDCRDGSDRPLRLGKPVEAEMLLHQALHLRTPGDRGEPRAIYDLLSDPPLPGNSRLRTIAENGT
jgi:DDE_Tnp_1-associated